MLSAVMDKKERGPALSGWPSLVRLYGSLPCRCSYTIPHFAVVVNNFLVAAGAFAGCCLRAACGRPLEVPPNLNGVGDYAEIEEKAVDSKADVSYAVALDYNTTDEYQGADISFDVNVQCMQYRNTNSADWKTIFKDHISAASGQTHSNDNSSSESSSN